MTTRRRQLKRLGHIEAARQAWAKELEQRALEAMTDEELEEFHRALAAGPPFSAWVEAIWAEAVKRASEIAPRSHHVD